MASSNVWVLRNNFNPHLSGLIRGNPRPGDHRTAYWNPFPSVGRFGTIKQLKRMVTSGMFTRGHGVIHRGPWIEDKEEARRRGCYQFFYREGRGVFSDCLLELEVAHEW